MTSNQRGRGGEGANGKTSLPKHVLRDEVLGGIEGGREWLPSLRQGRGDWQQMLESLGQLYVRGVAVDFSGLYGEAGYRRLQLPTYPFQRKRYWIDAPNNGPEGFGARLNVVFLFPK